MVSGSDAEIVEIIGLIYDAVIDRTVWQQALDRLRIYTGTQLGALAVHSIPRHSVIVQVATNIPDQFLATMSNYAADVVALWGGQNFIATAPVEEPVIQSTVTGLEVWQKFRFYTDWGRPQGLVDQIGMLVVRDSTMFGSLGLGIHESGRLPTEEVMDGLRVIASHLRRAVIISGMLDASTVAALTFQAALETTSSAVLLVDADMRLVHANAAAQTMLAAGDPVRIIGGRVALRELVPGHLQSAVRTASENEAALGRRGIGVPTRLRDGTALSLSVMPLERRPPAGIAPSATAAIFIGPAAAPLEMPADALRLLYDLTPAEQRVFELVVAGKETHEIAAALRVSVGTVRTHLLRVFEKTGRHSRADLVRLAGEIRLPG
ncbi:MAG: LuxR C-terminal-related transcriptional regulator [Alphaproteobacteria bacterium]